MRIPSVLTIAGSDSGGGAGIQADLKTYTALGVFGMSAITSLTAQNTTGVYGIFDIDPGFVAKQIDVIFEDLHVDVVKTGMLSNAKIIRAVASTLKKWKVEKIVVDPVMRAKGGDPLLKPEATETLISEFLPMAYIVTPNVPEAEVLAGMEIKTGDDMLVAAKKIRSLGPKYVLMKGGHLEEGKIAIDYLFTGEDFYEFRAERFYTKNTHGTGCTYASAIAAYLAKGQDIVDAVINAKIFVTGGVKYSLEHGNGHGPVNHEWLILGLEAPRVEVKKL